jgi:hypothetical protein
MHLRTRTALAMSAAGALVLAGTLAACLPSTAAPEPTASATVCAPDATPTPTPTATPTPTPTADPTALPVGDVTSNGRTWRQSFAEDFTKPAALGKVASVYPGMGFYDGFSDTSKLGTYAPSKVLSVADGNLDYYLHAENGKPLVATVMPDGYAPHTTARVSIRYKTTTTDGYKFVGMLWPSSDQWNEGEIDWPEANLGAKARPASAVPGSYSNGAMTFEPPTEQFADTDTTAYHVATTEWDKGIVRFYWDGKLVASTTKAVPTKPMRVTLQGETWIGQGAVPRGAAGHVSVDWISVWD